MTCGDGVQERTRDIIQAPAGSGKACEPQREQQSCNLKPCGKKLRLEVINCTGIYQLMICHSMRYWAMEITALAFTAPY